MLGLDRPKYDKTLDRNAQPVEDFASLASYTFGFKLFSSSLLLQFCLGAYARKM